MSLLNTDYSDYEARARKCVDNLKNSFVIDLQKERQLYQLYYYLFVAKSEPAKKIQLSAIEAALIPCQPLHIRIEPPLATIARFDLRTGLEKPEFV